MSPSQHTVVWCGRCEAVLFTETGKWLVDGKLTVTMEMVVKMSSLHN